MTADLVSDHLRQALDGLALPDSVEDVVARGSRIRRQRQARRATVSIAALSLGVVTAAAWTDQSQPTRRSPLILAAADLPLVPVSLGHMPSNVERSTDFDDGHLRLHYVDSDGSLVGLAVFETRPSNEPGDSRPVEVLGRPGTLTRQEGSGEDARAQLVWERRPGQWIRMVGQSDDADPEKLLAYARDVVDVPVDLDMHLRVAPASWEVRHYKDLGSGGVVDLGDPADERRSVVVALQHTPYRGFDADSIEYRGPITTHTVQGRRAHLIEAPMGWYLQALTGDAWFTVQASADLSVAQVLEIAEGVRATDADVRKG